MYSTYSSVGTHVGVVMGSYILCKNGVQTCSGKYILYRTMYFVSTEHIGKIFIKKYLQLAAYGLKRATI
jgi:hypothetical protein